MSFCIDQSRALFIRCPLKVSPSAIPAVKMIGREMAAIARLMVATPITDRESTAMVVAVSNPSPNSSPIMYICAGLLIGFMKRDQNPCECFCLFVMIL